MKRIVHFGLPDSPDAPKDRPTAPIVYVEEPLAWAYHQITRDIDADGPIPEAELNTLGAEGWELAAVIPHANRAVYIFKQPKAP